MNNPLSNKVILYSSLLFTAVIGLPKLLALQKDVVIPLFVRFNLYEWLIQNVVSFIFCCCIFLYFSKRINYFNHKLSFKKQGKMLLVCLGITGVLGVIAGLLSRMFFHVSPLNGYLFRLLTLLIFVFIETKILATLFYARQKDTENEQLRMTNMRMELDLLKSQLNPHFFFNALSSLSGVVRENPQQAQNYISHLSKIFRYSLKKTELGLVTLKEELDEANSYGELMKMRHEEGFNINNNILAADLQLKLPQLSIQPLLENALKHNVSTIEKPLSITIAVQNKILSISNNLQPKLFAETGTGIGLANLNDRFKILLKKEIEIDNSNNSFTVKLPLQ